MDRRRLTIGILALALMAGGVAWRCSPRPLPPIARNLPGDFATAERIFNSRLKRQYPVGSMEVTLADDLRAQGFQVGDDGDGYNQALMSRFNGCGSTIWRVHWRADASGRITEIFGVHGAVCI